ncbi:hypothetical protein [Adhaeribacter rhizoryzae]|uniref:VCBS repeat-containing protein n=1 Tax=Adhaeribacter rhizoryzae TaxID=2607907 RepID=A0A5M6DNE0_9BACT|nr:hypothetical protein [Adhaeribacter rhizoryzae]KAA5547916.1 hypothetical protein F0145_08235 [Adhaeribacter rhizoryzae]
MKAPLKAKTTVLFFLPVLLLFNCSEPKNSNPVVTKAVPVELPKWTWAILEAENFKEKYEYNFQINPFYLQADFDKDGFLDIAILIKESATSKTGLMVLRQQKEQPEIFGAGQQNTLGTEDWNWLQTWKTENVLPAGADVQPAGAVLILLPKAKNQIAPWLFWQEEKWQWKID